MGLTPPGIPNATPVESHANKTEILVERKVCGVLVFLKRVVPQTGKKWKLARMHLMVVGLIASLECSKRHKRSKRDGGVGVSLSDKGPPLQSVASSFASIRL